MYAYIHTPEYVGIVSPTYCESISCHQPYFPLFLDTLIQKTKDINYFAQKEGIKNIKSQKKIFSSQKEVRDFLEKKRERRVDYKTADLAIKYSVEKLPCVKSYLKTSYQDR